MIAVGINLEIEQLLHFRSLVIFALWIAEDWDPGKDLLSSCSRREEDIDDTNNCVPLSSDEKEPYNTTMARL